MKKIVLLADGAPFNSHILAHNPLGGAESACIRFCEALARQGHHLHVYTTAAEKYHEGNIHWHPLTEFTPQAADLVIAHRSPHLLSRYPVNAPSRILYVHNPTQYLSKWRHRKYLYQYKPDVIFSGPFHASTWPKLLPNTQHLVIPYAVDEIFLHETTRTPPPPTAIFTSNPLRGLSWLLNVWEHAIFPNCPEATLHLYCGPAVYPGLHPKKAAAMMAVLDQARALSDCGVILHDPIPKDELARAIKESRVMLYPGDTGESFCMALAEAQALGVPAITQAIGSCAERVIDGLSGFIAAGQTDFARQAVRLLTNDTLWQAQHQYALREQTQYHWDDAARSFCSKYFK